MADPFSEYQPGLDAPASRAFVISPSDSTDLDPAVRAIKNNTDTAGDVKINTVGGDTEVIVSLGPYELLPVRVSRVWDADTDITSILGLV